MVYGKFLERNNRIKDMLDKIASRTETMTLANCAKSSNDEFVAIMHLQEKLLLDAEKLFNEFDNLNAKGIS